MQVVMLWLRLAFGHIRPFVQLERRLTSADAGAVVHVTFLTVAGNVPRVEAMPPFRRPRTPVAW